MQLDLLPTIQQAIYSLLVTYEPAFLRLGFQMFMSFATVLIVWHGIQMMFTHDGLSDAMFEFAKFLLLVSQFVVKHFSRIRSTLQREYSDSLFFLEPALADATIAQNEQSRTLEMFVSNASANEVEVLVQNVSLTELSTSPFKATVSFQKVYYLPGTRTERNRESYVAQVDFVLRDGVPNEFVRVNPLGLQIAYFRVDQAFEEARR